MSDAYTVDEAPDDTEAPDAIEPGEGSEPGEGKKATQQEANYREGNPQRSCGLCGYFDSKGHSCDVVEGEISPFGFSNLYLRQDNPFRTGEKEAFKGGTKVAVIPRMATMVPPPPGLVIGRRSYGGES